MPKPTKEAREKRLKLIKKGLKDCTKCEEIKPLFKFVKQSGRPGGVSSRCKECINAYHRKKYPEKKDEISEYHKAHYLKNKKRIDKRNKKYIRKRRKDPEYRKREREHNRKYNKSKHGKRVRQRYANSEARKISQQNWSDNNREKKNAHWAVWKACNDGILKRPEVCEKCGEKDTIHAHHHKGYAKKHRLDVQWLCVSCHEKSHHNL